MPHMHRQQDVQGTQKDMEQTAFGIVRNTYY